MRKKTKRTTRNTAQVWDYDDIRDPTDKTYMLTFQPYLETPDGQKAELTIGYLPRRRGYGYGRWEEFFLTLPEARRRMDFLASARAIEDAEIRKEIPGGGMMTTLVDAWRDEEGDED